jgi:hypothetical protein
MQNNLTSTYQANKWTFQDRHGVQNPNGYSIDVPNWGGNVLNSTSVTVQNAWIHLAFVRSGNTVYLFLDGILEDSAVISGSIDGGVAQGLHIGGQSNGKIKGYYDEIRALSGEAAWTSDFTPPTVEYSVPAVLLPIFNKKFIQNNTLLRR